MRAEVRHGDTSHPTLAIGLGSGETITAEAGAMMTLGDGIRVRRPDEGGISDAVHKRVSDRTPVRVVAFSAEGTGEVTLAPPLPGDIVRVAVGEKPVYVVQSGSFLAAQDGVKLRVAADSDQTLRGEELSFLQLVGSGAGFLAAYGAIEARSLNRGDTLTVDAGHVVAFAGVDHDLETVEGLKSAVFEEEGVVSRFTGPGRVWLQTRSHDSYLSWLQPQLANLQ
ncbi:MAG: TIGR00266 family protein [Halanaeroarchaeum sp.]